MSDSKVRATLVRAVIVECPECENVFNLLGDAHTISHDEGGCVTNQLAPMGDNNREFELEATCTAQGCRHEFTVEGIDCE